MSRVQIGEKTGDGKFWIDLPRLIETRALIQANSGGGKSYVIRKLLEETHGKVQQIVLDVEGEFASLRSKFDYILAGKGGDVAADPKTAELLARKLLELGADCIIDLYELRHHERHRFMKLFLDSLMNAPKDLWHPVLVIVDEAHLFAPEKGQSEAMNSVIDLATRGRKREFAAVLATQRISKLHKDVAAECLNKLIGRTGLDIDMKRAADELGFTSKEQMLSLRDLEPGEFYAFGPAISKAVAHVTIGEVITPHGKAARKMLARRPVATAKVKQILTKLADLPKEAEEEIRDREALTKRVRELERELKTQPKPVADEKAIERTYQKAVADTEKVLLPELKKLRDFHKRISSAVAGVKPVEVTIHGDYSEALAKALKSSPPGRLEYVPPAVRPSQRSTSVDREGRTFGQCERKILGFLSLKPGEYFTKVQIGAMTGYSHGSGGFNNALSNLTQAGLILRNGGTVALNPDADVSELVDSTPHTLQDWVAKLGACERKIYSMLLEEPDQTWTKEEVGEVTGYSAGSGGFNNALSRLNTLGLIKRHHGGRIGINPEIASI